MLRLINLVKSFPGNFEPVLKGIDLELKAGDFCVIIGSNGSGKSTLIKLISGEISAEQGHIMIDGQDLTHTGRSHLIASVVQEINKGTVPEMTLLENMVLSHLRTKKAGFAFYRRCEPVLIQHIQKLGIGLERSMHLPLSHLSGGQRQMVATVMAVSTRPKLLLLDEHTSALDPQMQAMVMDYTATAISEQKLTTLMITHKLTDAIQYGNRLIMLHKGKIVLDRTGQAKANLNSAELLALFHHYEDLSLLSKVEHDD